MYRYRDSLTLTVESEGEFEVLTVRKIKKQVDLASRSLRFHREPESFLKKS